MHTVYLCVQWIFLHFVGVFVSAVKIIHFVGVFVSEVKIIHFVGVFVSAANILPLCWCVFKAKGVPNTHCRQSFYAVCII